jgi:hypothetical protein
MIQIYDFCRVRFTHQKAVICQRCFLARASLQVLLVTAFNKGFQPLATRYWTARQQGAKVRGEKILKLSIVYQTKGFSTLKLLLPAITHSWTYSQWCPQRTLHVFGRI